MQTACANHPCSSAFAAKPQSDHVPTSVGRLLPYTKALPFGHHTEAMISA